jgi:hypothetical protein
MMDRAETGNGFSVLDGIALVTGAAVASVHFRSVIREGLTAFGWVLIWGTFTWVAVTASGPFLFLVHRFARRSADYPKIGDGLWALLGLPWLLTAVLRSAGPGREPPRDDLFATALSTSLAVASLISLAVVWRTWVMVPPERAAQTAATPWTNRVGLIVAIAWPIQCGIGMVVVS